MTDVIIIGAGAAGLMAAQMLGNAGKKVLVLEHSAKPGAKILISGGGRCNFTNLDVSANNFLSANRHFAKSALSRYTPWDFMDFLAAKGATWHEKTLGQLFCDQGARKVLDSLLSACDEGGVSLKLNSSAVSVEQENGLYRVKTSAESYEVPTLIMATGGLSIPKMGATDFSYRLARQFGLKVVEPKPALVPFVFDTDTVAAMKALAGVSAPVRIRCGHTVFSENLLFTHRGLSGPAILQISSYWDHGSAIEVDLLPDVADKMAFLKDARRDKPKASLKTILVPSFPERLAEYVAAGFGGNMADLSNKALSEIADKLGCWHLVPTGTEGFKKAEVTKGGVSTDCLSSRTMEAKNQPGLYFIGECVDVTGWLGGYNFQWAWASAAAAAQAIVSQA